ncbi:MAG: hypothetical protein U0930_03310 [Pirellulales bacterium]
MMGTYSKSDRKKRAASSATSTRFRKLIFQELDRRVCFNVDYGDAGTLSIDLESSQSLFEQQISFLNQITDLNSAGDISLPAKFSKAVLFEIQQLNSQLEAIDLVSNSSVSQSNSSESTTSKSTSDTVISPTSQEHLPLIGDTGSDLVTLDWAFATSDSYHFLAVRLSDVDEDTPSLTLSTVRGNPDVLGTTVRIEVTPSQNTTNSVGQIASVNSNPTSGVYTVVAPKPGPQLDSSLPPASSSTPTLPSVAAPFAAPIVTSPSSSETRSNGLLLQSSLTLASQSSLEHPENSTNSHISQGWGEASTSWFAGKAVTSDKDYRRDTSKLISSRQQLPAARMQRAHMTISRSRSVAEIATAKNVNVSQPIAVDNSSSAAPSSSASQNSSNSNANLHINVGTTKSSLSDAHVLQSSNQTANSTESYFGNLESVREAIQDSSKSPQGLLLRETHDSDLTSVLRKQIPLAAAIAVGTLARRSKIDRPHLNRPKGNFHLAENSDISYPA